MLKKNCFSWSSEQAQALNTLKTKLTSAPVMALPNFSIPFVLETVACEMA
jgi:hypothetical protein